MKEIFEKLILILRNLESEEEVDEFLRPIHDFLFHEPIDTIIEVVRKLSEIFGATHETFNEREELEFCLKLALTGKFQLMKEYVLNHFLINNQMRKIWELNQDNRSIVRKLMNSLINLNMKICAVKVIQVIARVLLSLQIMMMQSCNKRLFIVI